MTYELTEVIKSFYRNLAGETIIEARFLEDIREILDIMLELFNILIYLPKKNRTDES